jgi:Protein of unknown function (DUF3617)
MAAGASCRAFRKKFAMRRSLIVCLVALIALDAYAAGFGLKPGLWEVRVVKQIVDGRDVSAQVAGATAQLQQLMANMPAEQRAKIDAMLKDKGISQGSDGNFHLCVSPEMAKLDKPIVDKDGHCQPATLKHSGNKTTYEFNCTANGVTSSGKGEATVAGDLITTQTDATTKNTSGATHVMHNESEMKFLGADCGNVKPPSAPSE